MSEMDPVKLSCEATCLCFHPSKSLLSAGTIEGQIKIYSYDDGKVRDIMSFNQHKKAVRALGFLSEGVQLVCGSSDKSFSVTNIETGQVEYRLKKSHEDAVYSLAVVDRHIFATGDDSGCFRLWDARHRKEIMKLQECSDSITDMVVDSSKSTVLATSSEGTLSAIDIRKHKLKVQSELIDSGLQSVAIIKNGEKVVCGGEDGVLHFFNRGEWGNICDRYPGHPMSIEKIIPLPSGLICTAASDAIRAVNLFPNKILDIIGDHDGLPIEGLSLSHCGKWLASCSHDEHIRFWDVSQLESETGGKSTKARPSKKKYVPKSEVVKRKKFFSDLVDNMKSTGDDDECEEGTSSKSDGNADEDCEENNCGDDDEKDSDDDDDDEDSDDD